MRDRYRTGDLTFVVRSGEVSEVISVHEVISTFLHQLTIGVAKEQLPSVVKRQKNITNLHS